MNHKKTANHDMTWYFDRALEKGAVLLDGANLDKDVFPLFSCFKSELDDISNGIGLELGYSYPGGQNELRELIANHQSIIENTEIKKNHVVVNSGGCSGTFDNIFRILSKGNKNKKEIIIPTPCYPEIIKSIKFNGLKPIFIQTNKKFNFQPTSKQIKEKINKNTLAIFLITPGNPSCTYIETNTLSQVYQLAQKNNCYLIIDAIFEEAPGLLKKQQIFHSCNHYKKLIKISSWSKDRPQLNDLRLGWSVSENLNFNSKLIAASEVSDYSNSTLSERLAIVDMRNRKLLDSNLEGTEKTNLYKKEINSYHKKIKDGMNQALELISKSPVIEDFVQPTIGNVIFAKVISNPEIKNSHDLFLHILEKNNILVSPGHIFHMPKNELWFRITMSRDPKKFVFYVNKILRSLQKLKC